MSKVSLREIDPRGSLAITGSLGVSGSFNIVADSPVTITTADPGQVSLVVSGAMEIVKAEVQSQIVSASLSVENLGSLADRSSSNTIDLGGFF